MTLQEWLILAKSQTLNSQQAHADVSPIPLESRSAYKTTAQNAAVMLLICGSTIDTAFIPVIKRSKKHKIHAGQMGFPGGKCEAQDTSIFDTALRECYEEIGITANSEHCALSPVFIPISGMHVQPFIAHHQNNTVFFKLSAEVEQMYRLPLTTISKLQIEYTEIETRIVPGFKIEHEFIWGASAMILNEFKTLWQNLLPKLS